MKYLFCFLLIGCNWGLVDVKEHHKTCYSLTTVLDINTDTTYVDSTSFECGSTDITTPFDDMLKYW